jgi:hypothetical protein
MLGISGCGLAANVGSSQSVFASQLAASSSTVSFGNVPVGSPASESVILKDMGPGNVTVSGLAVMGVGFTITGGGPATLTPNQSMTVSVSFTPTAAGSAQGTLAVLSNATATTLDVALTATGVAAPPPSSQLQASTTNLNFGNVTVGNTASQLVTLTNSGNANVVITGVSASGNGFTASGGSSITLAPSNSVTITVNFAPSQAGSASGTLAVVSNASDSTLDVGLSGNATTQTVAHQVQLNWQASASTVIGYYVYRGSASNSLSKLTGAIDQLPSYTDASVSAGLTYYYAVTSVGTDNVESAQSNQVSVTIPNN